MCHDIYSMGARDLSEHQWNTRVHDVVGSWFEMTHRMLLCAMSDISLEA